MPLKRFKKFVEEQANHATLFNPTVWSLAEQLSDLFKGDDERDILCEAPAPPGAQLFHKDIGIPQAVSGPRPGLRLTYGSHAKRAAYDDGLKRVPLTVPAVYTLIEVETVRGQVTKWVIRIPAAPGEDRDLIIVCQPDGFVRTVWTNHKDDSHKTLRRDLYTNPKFYRAA